jgi:hypothetical protein
MSARTRPQLKIFRHIEGEFDHIVNDDGHGREKASKGDPVDTGFKPLKNILFFRNLAVISASPIAPWMFRFS